MLQLRTENPGEDKKSRFPFVVEHVDRFYALGLFTDAMHAPGTHGFVLAVKRGDMFIFFVSLRGSCLEIGDAKPA